MFSLVEAVERSQRQRETASRDSTAKFSDSEIVVSVSVNDMKDELLEEVKGKPVYAVLKRFLINMEPHPVQGFGIFIGNAERIREFTSALNTISSLQPRLQPIVLDEKMKPPVIMSHLKVFLEDKRENVKDEIFSKFYRYVKKAVSLEYKNLKHIPKRRYYGSAEKINEFREALLSKEIAESMRSVLEIPVNRNNGIGLSSNKELLLKVSQSLKPILCRDNFSPYLNNIISKTYDKNRAFHEFLNFLKLQVASQTGVNRSFLRYILKVAEIEYRGSNYPTRRTEPIEIDLFPPGSPKVEDIRQGRIGDCYLLAALMSIIHKNPGYIVNCFPERRTYAPDQETVKVRLHKVKVTIITLGEGDFAFSVSPTGTVTIELDNTVFMKRTKVKTEGKYLGVSRDLPFGNRAAALWVNFMEKAFSIYKNIPGVLTVEGEAEIKKAFMELWEKGPDHSLSGQNVNGGWEFMPLSIITGKESVSGSLEYISEMVTKNWGAEKTIPPLGYSAKDNAIFRYIHHQLSGDRKVALTASTRDDIVGDRKKGIVKSHAYSIQGTQIIGDKKYIILKNPHMDRALDDPVNNVKLDVGTVKLELRDFIRCFKDINESNLK